MPAIDEETSTLINGEPIEDVAAMIREATLTGDISSPYYYTRFPVGLVDYEGTTLIYNTRTSAALTEAGIPREYWITQDVTDSVKATLGENYISDRLINNRLGSEGSETLRIGQGGPTSSTEESVTGTFNGPDPATESGIGAPPEDIAVE